MKEWKQSPYEAVPAEEQVSHSHEADHTTVEYPTVDFKENNPQPQPLGASWLQRVLRLIFDLVVASVALLFAIFGIWVYRIDGDLAGPQSTGSKLFEVSQYAPTIFPVLFAAIAGSSMKSLASWRIQTSRGATIGLLQQCIGSQNISGAFLTQIRLRSLNSFAIFTMILWCLSPLGSQASLRVISIVTSDLSSSLRLATMNTFTRYQYSYAEGMSEAVTTVANPVIASISAASLLGNRNQDLWGNIRFPMIENLKNASNDWMDVPQNNNLTYASLVGTPVSSLPGSGNTSFIIPGSYMSISCPVLGLANLTSFTNYTSSDAPSPDNGADCSWTSFQGGSQYQIAISEPCSGFNESMASGTRNARSLIWESQESAGSEDITLWTYAKCDLSTTYVDANVTCTESVSGTSSASTCNLFSVRRSLTPQFDRNWTVLDFNNQGPDAGQVLHMLTGLFPYAQLSGGTQPVLMYLTDPYHAVGGSGALMRPYTVGRQVFATRLAQLLNSILYLGINPSAFTGSFNPSSVIPLNSDLHFTATTTIQQERVKCNRPWLGVLIVASLTIFVFALIGAFLRMMTLTPDILGSISVILLHNKIRGITGSSTWSSDTWARSLRDSRLYLGDIEPDAQFGCIALATSPQDVHVPPVKQRRYI